MLSRMGLLPHEENEISIAVNGNPVLCLVGKKPGISGSQTLPLRGVDETGSGLTTASPISQSPASLLQGGKWTSLRVA